MLFGNWWQMEVYGRGGITWWLEGAGGMGVGGGGKGKWVGGGGGWPWKNATWEEFRTSVVARTAQNELLDSLVVFSDYMVRMGFRPGRRKQADAAVGEERPATGTSYETRRATENGGHPDTESACIRTGRVWDGESDGGGAGSRVTRSISVRFPIPELAGSLESDDPAQGSADRSLPALPAGITSHQVCTSYDSIQRIQSIWKYSIRSCKLLSFSEFIYRKSISNIIIVFS